MAGRPLSEFESLKRELKVKRYVGVVNTSRIRHESLKRELKAYMKNRLKATYIPIMNLLREN